MDSTFEVGRARVEQLSHHGVLGMKWGHRKASSSGDGRLSESRIKGVGRGIANLAGDVRFENHTADPETRFMIAHNATQKFHEKDLAGLKAKHGASAELRTRD